MNIVHIYPNAKRFHGAVKILFLFCTKLEEIGHNNTILCGSINRHVPDWFSGKIVSLFKNPLANKEHVGFKKILFVLFQNIIPFVLPFKLKKMQPDVIVFHSEPSLFAVITARILQIKSKYIYYCYQAPEEFYNYSKETKKRFGLYYIILIPLINFYKLLDRMLVRNVDHVLVWSREYKDFVKEIYGNLNYEIVPAGFDPELLKLKDSHIHRRVEIIHHLCLQNKKILLNISTLTKRKNLFLFLKLIKSLSELGYLVHGLIIGEGPERKNIEEAIAQLEISQSITLLGFISEDDLPIYYNLSEIIYHLKVDCGWAMTVAEAGLFNKPAIIVSGRSAASLVKHNSTGFIINKNKQEDEILRYTTFLLDNPKDREKMGIENYYHAMQYSEDKCVEKFLTLFK